ncbi:MAG: lipid A biosynthesis acyltransferase [Lysobacterales bacterium]|nr:lipid A biosynthesis acyltransferase [Xanthomonadales bacterium]
MAARLTFALMWLLGRLPLAALHGLGAGLGRVWLAIGAREARVAATNLALCFPEQRDDQRHRLCARCMGETGKTAAELCWLWTRDATAVNARIRVVEGESLFLDALASRRGVLIAAPHLGAWEALNLYLSRTAPVAILYRPPRQAWVETLINRCRGRFGAEPVRAEAAGVRILLKRLKDGGVVGILPDQQPKVGEGEFAPFFGQSALTMSLFTKLATRTGAKVLFAWAERLPAGAGFAVRFLDRGPVADAAAMNAIIEELARGAPAQYQWTYKRFGIQPDGGESPYRQR